MKQTFEILKLKKRPNIGRYSYIIDEIYIYPQNLIDLVMGKNFKNRGIEIGYQHFYFNAPSKNNYCRYGGHIDQSYFSVVETITFSFDDEELGFCCYNHCLYEKKQLVEYNGELYHSGNMRTCSCCGEQVPYSVIEWIGNDTPYCDDCVERQSYQGNISRCDNCGDWFFTEDLYYGVCSSCREDDGDGYFIHDYHDSHDDDVIFFGGKDDGKTLFMGVELEIDNGANRSSVAEDIYYIMPNDFITAENDGSLNSGFENITQPATLSYHESIKDRYKKMFDLAIENDFRSHDTKTCGYHIHFNRSYFGEDREEECTAKLLYLVEKFWDDLVKFSRRTESQLNNWAARYNCTPQEAIDKNDYKKTYNGNRYYAINLTNSNTIEFRMFRGTLNIDTFFATLQLVNNIVTLCKEEDNEELHKLKFEDLLTTDVLKTYWERVKVR